MIRPLATCAIAFIVAACGQFSRQPAETVLRYQCGTLPLTVRQSTRPPQVALILDGRQLTLPETVAASGVRYSDGHYTFWSKGQNAFVERAGKVIINDCIIAD